LKGNKVTYEFDVKNMTCDHCRGAVEKAIIAADPAAVVTIDLAARKATVQTSLAPVVISDAIQNAGYPAFCVQP
tara:strand:+ start:207 stop:428 length:222 start_codon:yes stop_codon:yes gene_type:complete